ncbi:hypothetical protein [Micromonospora sp. NPDC004704]
MTTTTTRRLRSAWPYAAGLVLIAGAMFATRGAPAVDTTVTPAVVTTPAATPPATPPAGPSYEIPGRVRLVAGQYATQGAACSGVGEYAPTQPGAQIVVTDLAGTAVTYSTIAAGTAVGSTCELPFLLDIPVGAGTYGVDVPGWAQLVYVEADLRDMLELTIG